MAERADVLKLIQEDSFCKEMLSIFLRTSSEICQRQKIQVIGDGEIPDEDADIILVADKKLTEEEKERIKNWYLNTQKKKMPAVVIVDRTASPEEQEMDIVESYLRRGDDIEIAEKKAKKTFAYIEEIDRIFKNKEEA